MSTKIPLVGGTTIEWADYTFNPWWGCTKVPGSPACVHCYAETWATRWKHDVWGAAKPRRFFGDSHWNEPRKWDRKAAKEGIRYRVFCASMADVFEDRADLDEHRLRLWDLIESTPHLDWLLLTKRPEQIGRMVPWARQDRPDGYRWWPSNAWVGTTVEDQRWADVRIPHLLEVPAPVRFLSVEPMLGPVDLDRPGWLRPGGKLQAGPIGWVICGGESGPKARPLDPEDVRRLRDQCVDAGVPFFFKQWGEWMPHDYGPPPFWLPADGSAWVDGHELPADLSEGRPVGGWWAPDITDEAIYHRVGKAAAGRMLDGRFHDGFPVAS